MDELRFIWRRDKMDKARQKHGVTYEEVVGAILDPVGPHFEDGEHWGRFIAVGKTKAGRLLSVVYAEDETEPPETYRLITAYDAPKEHANEYS